MLKLVSATLLSLIVLLACSTPAISSPPVEPTVTVGPTKSRLRENLSSYPRQTDPGITVKATNEGYEKVYTLVGGDGTYEVSAQRWQQIMDILGWEYTPTDRQRSTRWAEQQNRR